MNRQPVSARAVLLLIAAVLILPIAMSLTVALAALLRAMGDETGGQALGYVCAGVRCALDAGIGLPGGGPGRQRIGRSTARQGRLGQVVLRCPFVSAANSAISC